MKTIYRICDAVSSLAFYLLGKQQKTSQKVIWSFILLCLLPLKMTAQDVARHDPLAGPFGHYPFWANSVEILSLTDSLNGSSQPVPSQRIFDMTPDKQIAASSPHIAGSGSFSINGSLWYDCAVADFDGDGKDEMLAGWVSYGGVLHLEMCRAEKQESNTWQWEPIVHLDNTWICNGPIRLLTANLDSSARKEIIVCTHVRNSYYPQYNDLKVVPFFMDDQGQTLEQEK
ncbi:MAG: hypothetical protein P8184_18650 [Calditrichia bacterium]